MKKSTTKISRLATMSAIAAILGTGSLYGLSAFTDKPVDKSSYTEIDGRDGNGIHSANHEYEKDTMPLRVSINQADALGLQGINGIGERLAERIVRNRENHGDFESLEDLARVKGISVKLVDRNRDHLRL
jgi:competence protein ComEA